MPADAYSFPLAWLWTQPSHNVLPPEVMTQVTPNSSVPLPTGMMTRGELNPSLFDEIQTASADVTRDEGIAWLRRLSVARSQRVTVGWDTSTAVRTTSGVFTRYWDDFCYPSSDDVEVFPGSGAWLLLYHHWELFEWGRRRRAYQPPQWTGAVSSVLSSFWSAEPPQATIRP